MATASYVLHVLTGFGLDGCVIQGYGQDKPERCSKPAWPSSRASTFGTAEGPIAGGAVVHTEAVDQVFRAESSGFSEIRAGG